MAYIDCVVDTKPMAREIATVSNNVNKTTGAVIGMKAAVIKAESDAADLVCDNVNKGFYTLIHSQISQKIAKLKSEVDSHLLKLNQLNKQLSAIRNRMEKDYHMISERYTTLFGRLNKNLENRIYEIDKPTITFAVKEMNAISNRGKLLTAIAPVSQTESITTSQRIIASNMKYSGLQVIESMNRFLGGLKEQKELSEHILLTGDVDKDKSTIMIPVVIVESNYDKYDNKCLNIETNRSGLSKDVQDNIKNSINTSSLNWQEQEEINNELKSEFHKYLSASNASERVKKMTEKLFISNNFKTTKI